MTERKRNNKLGSMYQKQNAYYMLPGLAFFALLWYGISGGLPYLIVGATGFVLTIVIAFVWEHHRFRLFKCPECSHLMPEPDRSKLDIGDAICFHCTNCDIEWDSGLRISDD